MKKFSYIIAIIALFIAFSIIELLIFNDFKALSLIIIVLFIIASTAFNSFNYYNAITKSFRTCDLKRLEQLIIDPKHSYIYNQFSINDFKLFVDVVLGYNT